MRSRPVAALRQSIKEVDLNRTLVNSKGTVATDYRPTLPAAAVMKSARPLAAGPPAARTSTESCPVWSHTHHVPANAEHVKQNCQLFNMNRRMYGVTRRGGQGPTKPGACRGYGFEVSVWACRVEQGALGNVQEECATPPPSSLAPPPGPSHPPHPLHSSSSFSSRRRRRVPALSFPCTLYVLLHFPL